VFFVISGFLIASIILKDIEAQRFSFVSFYERRMRRIFPALFAVSFCSILAAAVLFEPHDFFAFGNSLMAMATFVSNRFFASSPAGYFNSASSTDPLLHTWSLSLEEQFYLLFPAFLLLLNRFFKRHRGWWLTLAIAASFILSVYRAVHEPPEAFYLLAPRAWELLIGAVLAVSPTPQLQNRPARELAGIAGLGLIIYAITMFGKQTIFPGFNALFPCIGAWLIIYAGESGASFVKAILSFKPLVFIGLTSYSIYLWHWPIIVFTRYFNAGNLERTGTVLVVLSSLLAGFISFEFIESPFRGKSSAITRRQIYSFGITASMVSLALGFVIYSSKGLPQRYNAKTREIISMNWQRKSDFDESCSNWQKDVQKLSDIDFCEVAPAASHNIMFWGDSHVQQLMPLVRNMHAGGKLSKGAIFAIESGCPLAEDMNRTDAGSHCDEFAHFAMIRAREADIDTVFIAFSPWWAWPEESLCLTANGRCSGKLSGTEAFPYFLVELSREVRNLRAAGKRVIVALPFPVYNKSIPDLEIHNAVFGRLVGESVAWNLFEPGIRDQITSAATKAGAEIFDPRQSLCENQECIYQINGVSLYKDDNHMAGSGVGILEANLGKTLAGSY
jgi:peptidoglycan/LPS O-acetylase OafA/YrhL